MKSQRCRERPKLIAMLIMFSLGINLLINENLYKEKILRKGFIHSHVNIEI
ncbi:hypothetical protein YN1HA_13930 [Sulfurisphaera ohwakuensis]